MKSLSTGVSGPEVAPDLAGASRSLQLREWTVIIPTLGRPILQRCLQAIADGVRQPACIVLVDQGREHETVEAWLRRLNEIGLQTVHLVSRDRNPGLARNLAFANVKTSRVAAVDDDCIADQNWLKALDQRLNEHPGFIITGRVDPAGGGRAPTIVSADAPALYRAPSARRPSPLTSGNMGVAMQVVRQVGPFDGDLFTAEDNDWAHRALRRGIPILYAPEAIVQHFHWRSDSELASTFKDYATGQGYFYGKHLRRGDMLIALMASISLFRGARDFFLGSLSHNDYRRTSGAARIRWLIPAMASGFLHSSAKS